VLKTPYFAAYANTNWTVARHTLNFGVQGMYYKNYGWACSGCVGTFTFSGNTTDNSISSTGNFTPNPYAGSPFASFLIGEADSAKMAHKGSDAAAECVRLLTTPAEAVGAEFAAKKFPLPEHAVPRR